MNSPTSTFRGFAYRQGRTRNLRYRPVDTRSSREPTTSGRSGEDASPSPRSVQIESASAKIRTGGPIDDKDDYHLDFWAGVVPLQEQMLTPVSDPLSLREIAIPKYIDDFRRNRNG